MFWWLIVAVILYLLCAAALIAEVFVPSAGLLSLIALVCLAGGLYIFFHYSAVAGWIGVLLAVIMIPTVLILAYKIFPETKFGKTVILSPTERRHGDGVPDSEALQQLSDQAGVSITPLRPVGTCDFNGRRVQCVAESGFIEKGKSVSVVVVDGMRVVVAVRNQTDERS